MGHFHSCGVGEAAATALVGDGEEDGGDVAERRLSLATAAWESRASDQGSKMRKESSITLNHVPFLQKLLSFSACSPHASLWKFLSQPKRVNLLLLSLGHYNIARLTSVCSRGKNPTNQASYTETQCFVMLFVCVCPLPAASSIPSSWNS